MVRCRSGLAVMLPAWATAAVHLSALTSYAAHAGDQETYFRRTDSGRASAALDETAASAPDGVPLGTPGHWCGTHMRYLAEAQRARESGTSEVCPQDGRCDDPTLRDAMIPDADSPISIIRLTIHVLCEDDGSNCAATQADVDGQIATLNENYSPWRIQFVYENDFVNSTEFRYLQWPDEDPPMKSAFAEAPNEKLNIYVLFNESHFSYAVFPWEPGALTSLGGIVMTLESFKPGNRILAHEVGHALGLWHTHHGIWEYPEEYDDDPCQWPCYERADGTDADTTGDKCSDTPPTPGSGVCGPPGGIDDCTAVPWGTTAFRNYMAASMLACDESEFTDQQTGRFHCWLDDVLSGWIAATVHVPTLSGWAVVVTSLLLPTAGTVILRNRRGKTLTTRR